jgi:hypothetical protein
MKEREWKTKGRNGRQRSGALDGRGTEPWNEEEKPPGWKRKGVPDGRGLASPED